MHGSGFRMEVLNSLDLPRARLFPVPPCHCATAELRFDDHDRVEKYSVIRKKPISTRRVSQSRVHAGVMIKTNDRERFIAMTVERTTVTLLRNGFLGLVLLLLPMFGAAEDFKLSD